MKITCIGIDGAAGSGKDTLADYLVECHGYVKIAFADPMKRFCAHVYGWSRDILWGSSHLRDTPDLRYRRHDGTGEGPEFLTPRYALQQLGTAWGRDCWNPTWLEKLCADVEALRRDPWALSYSQFEGLILRADSFRFDGRIVVPDCRHAFELAGLAERYESVIIRVNRDGAGLDGQPGRHSSETERKVISDEEFRTRFGTVLDNNGSLSDLYAAADRLVG